MCNCATEADKKLAEMNSEIDWAWLINPKSGKTVHRLQVKTKKVNPRVRKGPAVLVASYCPFCGSSQVQHSGERAQSATDIQLHGCRLHKRRDCKVC